MPSPAGKPLFMLPGSTPVQRAASGLVYTTGNAAICTLTSHIFSLITPGSAALFGASSAVIGLALATRYALNDLENCKNMTELADKIAKTIISFFAGGGAGLLLTNALGFSIHTPAALVLMGPILTTSLGFLVLSVACYAASRLTNKGADILNDVRQRIRNQVEGLDS